MRILLATATLLFIGCGNPDPGSNQLAASAAAVTEDPGTGPIPGLFACGNALNCDGQTEYCVALYGGSYNPGHPLVHYSCAPIPVACAHDITRACIDGNHPPRLCKESDGDVTVTILAP